MDAFVAFCGLVLFLMGLLWAAPRVMRWANNEEVPERVAVPVVHAVRVAKAADQRDHDCRRRATGAHDRHHFTPAEGVSVVPKSAD